VCFCKSAFKNAPDYKPGRVYALDLKQDVESARNSLIPVAVPLGLRRYYASKVKAHYFCENSDLNIVQLAASDGGHLPAELRFSYRHPEAAEIRVLSSGNNAFEQPSDIKCVQYRLPEEGYLLRDLFQRPREEMAQLWANPIILPEHGIGQPEDTTLPNPSHEEKQETLDPRFSKAYLCSLDNYFKLYCGKPDSDSQLWVEILPNGATGFQLVRDPSSSADYLSAWRKQEENRALWVEVPVAGERKVSEFVADEAARLRDYLRGTPTPVPHPITAIHWLSVLEPEPRMEQSMAV